MHSFHVQGEMLAYYVIFISFRFHMRCCCHGTLKSAIGWIYPHQAKVKATNEKAIIIWQRRGYPGASSHGELPPEMHS